MNTNSKRDLLRNFGFNFCLNAIQETAFAAKFKLIYWYAKIAFPYFSQTISRNHDSSCRVSYQRIRKPSWRVSRDSIRVNSQVTKMQKMGKHLQSFSRLSVPELFVPAGTLSEKIIVDMLVIVIYPSKFFIFICSSNLFQWKTQWTLKRILFLTGFGKRFWKFSWHSRHRDKLWFRHIRPEVRSFFREAGKKSTARNYVNRSNPENPRGEVEDPIGDNGTKGQ